MNHLGEIDYLTRLASPGVALVNNAHRAHIGMLGTLEAIAQAKGEIYAGLRAGRHRARERGRPVRGLLEGARRGAQRGHLRHRGVGATSAGHLEERSPGAVRHAARRLRRDAAGARASTTPATRSRRAPPPSRSTSRRAPSRRASPPSPAPGAGCEREARRGRIGADRRHLQRQPGLDEGGDARARPGAGTARLRDGRHGRAGRERGPAARGGRRVREGQPASSGCSRSGR